MSLVIKFYLASSLLNMFQTLIHPSSGACDFSIVSPHWSCVLVSMCVGSFGVAGIRVAGWSTTASNCTSTFICCCYYSFFISLIYICFTTCNRLLYKMTVVFWVFYFLYFLVYQSGMYCSVKTSDSIFCIKAIVLYIFFYWFMNRIMKS